MAIQWTVVASACNADGPFDGAYDFGDGVGDSSQMVGTPEEIGQELTRFLKSMDKADMDDMRYGTSRFYIQLHISPGVEEV